jgi:hypothetical protein
MADLSRANPIRSKLQGRADLAADCNNAVGALNPGVRALT